MKLKIIFQMGRFLSEKVFNNKALPLYVTWDLHPLYEELKRLEELNNTAIQKYGKLVGNQYIIPAEDEASIEKYKLELDRVLERDFECPTIEIKKDEASKAGFTHEDVYILRHFIKVV